MKRYIVALVVLLFVGCGSTNTNTNTNTTKDLSVKIEADRSELVDGQSVTLEAKVTGEKESLTYIWSENNNTFGSSSTVTRKNFSLGKHEIDLKVSDGKKTVTAKKTITVSEFLLTLQDSKINHSIKHGETNYDVSENVVLEAKIVGLAQADTYTWKEKNNTISTTSKLDKKFSVGSHSVTVEARVNNLVKSASFDFNVSDWSNFDTKILSLREDKVLVDKEKKLMWVSDSDESKKACLAVHEGNLSVAKPLSQNFCKGIEFGGFEKGSWRVPTPNELSNFIKETVKANILPAYYQPCNILFADENGVSKVVATRYGVKEDIDGSIVNISAKLGDIIDYRTHYGIRCVKSLD
jgi:hypothetical protein